MTKTIFVDFEDKTQGMNTYEGSDVHQIKVIVDKMGKAPVRADVYSHTASGYAHNGRYRFDGNRAIKE